MPPVEFVLFGLTLLGVALLHHRTLEVALAGLATILVWKFIGPGFEAGPGLGGLLDHLAHEWVMLANLFALLTGFTILARHFEATRIPDLLPALLPDDWKGGFVLLCMVFVMSGFLDNIAAAMIGGTMAASVFRNRLHIGYLAAIVAASNAGGAGSVIGDTTTTMMWLEGVTPVQVLPAYLAAGAAFLVFAIPASLQQQRASPIVRDPPRGARVDWTRLSVVGALLGATVTTNVVLNLRTPALADRFPFLGAAVWTTIMLTTPLRRPDWALLPSAARGSVFLLALVLCASLMPVESLPPASWPTTLGLGFLSAVFDNIPLTKLALEEGGFDWGCLAYSVGFGGSMIWFGSSAGVALSNRFPDARSAGAWLKSGWHVVLGYLVGFFVLLLTLGWRPTVVPD